MLKIIISFLNQILLIYCIGSSDYVFGDAVTTSNRIVLLNRDGAARTTVMALPEFSYIPEKLSQ